MTYISNKLGFMIVVYKISLALGKYSLTRSDDGSKLIFDSPLPISVRLDLTCAVMRWEY